MQTRCRGPRHSEDWLTASKGLELTVERFNPGTAVSDTDALGRG